MAGSSDADLMLRIVHHEEDAFVEIYRRHCRSIYRFAYAMCGSEAIADETTQEVFLHILETADRFNSSLGSVRAWLYGIARNKVLTQLRTDARSDSDSALDLLPSDWCPMDRRIENDQRLESLRRAILALPPAYREVVTLCELEELSYAEASSVLGCPIGTVRSRLHRARAHLSSRLQPGDQGESDKTVEAGSRQ